MTTITLHNTATRRKEVFTPILSEDVRMYVCGPTVYDRAHLGNARAVVVFDTLYRLLRHVYGVSHVTYVRNFTDVDDKINAQPTINRDGTARGAGAGPGGILNARRWRRNFRDLLDQGVPGEVIRYVILGTHYRKPMDWTEVKRDAAEKVLRKWRKQTEGVAVDLAQEQASAILADDLNVAGVIARMHQLSDDGDAVALKATAAVLGLLTDELGDWAGGVDLSGLAARLSALRADAMATKDFAAVDALKAGLIAAGVEVKMSKEGVALAPAVGFDAAKLEGLG